VGKDQQILYEQGKDDFFYEFNIHTPAQYQRYGITFLNKHSSQSKDVTFALKLVRQQKGNE